MMSNGLPIDPLDGAPDGVAHCAIAAYEHEPEEGNGDDFDTLLLPAAGLFKLIARGWPRILVTFGSNGLACQRIGDEKGQA